MKEELEQTDSLYECEQLQERITRLSSGIAIIRVGAATQIDMIEKKHRIEDALEAVRSAQMEGIIPGGGVMLYRISKKLDVGTDSAEQALGVDIVKRALCSPLQMMARNSGMEWQDVASKIDDAENEDIGVNFLTGETTNLLESGVIDPVKVTRCALQNAASVAGILITTNYAIIE